MAISMNEEPFQRMSESQPTVGAFAWANCTAADLMESLFRQSAEAILLIDLLRERLLEANHKACELTGFKSEELQQAPLRSLIRHEQDWQDWLHRLDQSREWMGGYLLRNRTGWLPVEIQLTRLSLASNDPVGLLYLRDKHIEQELTHRLQRSETELRRVIAGISECVWSSRFRPDTGWVYRYLSPVVRQLTGLPVSRFLADPELWQQCIAAEDLPAWQAFRQRLQEGQSGSLEYRVVGPDGRATAVVETVLALRDDLGLILQGIISQRQDKTPPPPPPPPPPLALVTEERLDLVSRFASGLAHDFNNLITGILGHAGLGRMLGPANDPVQTELMRIESIAGCAAELCRKMHLWAGRSQVTGVCETPGRLLRELIDELRAGIAPGIRLTLQFADPEPAVLVPDERLRQLAEVLLRNAVDALVDSPGEIVVQTRRLDHFAPLPTTGSDCLSCLPADESSKAGLFSLEIRDTGQGIPLEVRSRIFNPYFSTRSGRRGLGLPLALGIVRSNKGAIRLVSEPGRGTTVTCWFALASPTPKPQQAAPTVSTSTAPLSRTILLVDDDVSIQEITSRLLQILGWSVVTAGSGEECLAQLSRTPQAFQAVLLDLTLPRMSGEQTLRQLRERHPTLPVVLMSGHPSEEVLDRLGDLNITSYLQKPFRMNALQTTLASVPAVSGEASQGTTQPSG